MKVQAAGGGQAEGELSPASLVPAPRAAAGSTFTAGLSRGVRGSAVWSLYAIWGFSLLVFSFNAREGLYAAKRSWIGCAELPGSLALTVLV